MVSFNWLFLLPSWVASQLVMVIKRALATGLPNMGSLATNVNDPIYGDFLLCYWSGGMKYVNVWVTDIEAEAPAGALPLAEVWVDPGQDYKLWYQFRATYWPPKPK
jgi:hypothetical protein